MRLRAFFIAVLLTVLGGALPLHAATVTRGPYLQLGTPDGIVVRWRTDVPTESRVSYGTNPVALDQQVQSGQQTTEHELALTGLQPDTRYYYSVGTSTEDLAGGDAEHYFETAPQVGTQKPTRIWVLGDSGTANADAFAVRDAYYTFAGAQHTQLWLMLGDNAYSSGTDEEYQVALFDVFPEMLRKSVLWPALGNHDSVASDSPTQTGPFFDMFTLPAGAEAGGAPSGSEAYYSFDFANVHFVVLDSFGSDRTPDGPMLTWLADDLAATDQDWIVAYWHHPPYSKGGHDSDDTIVDPELTDMRVNALPILENHGVDLVLSGHSHSYERSFLIDGHYGFSNLFGPENVVDGGDGREDGDGAYRKPALGQVPRQGAVYTVAGSFGQTTGGSLDHPAMFVSHNVLGSVVLDIDGDRLDATFLDWTGGELDRFTIVKDPDLVVEFSADPVTGSAPLAVQFTDLSLIQGTEWAWDFDDDGQVDSTEQHPVHVYDQSGSYSVKLAVSGSEGAFEKLKTDYVNVFLVPPVAEFSANLLLGVAPFSVEFTDLSQNTPSQWEWDFDGDAQVDSTSQHPTFVYEQPGVYSVSLTVTNAEGSDQESKPDYIVVIPDVPDGITGLVVGPAKSTISWDSAPDVCTYDLVKGDVALLQASAGDFSVSQLGCLEEDVATTQSTDAATPVPGQTFFYLVRGVNCSSEAGTYDTTGVGLIKSRDPGLQGPGASCGCQPTDDVDADGYCTALDNCPETYNVGQEDTDTDNFGDECDCDAVNPNCTTDCTDVDSDGFCVTTDCDDGDSAVNPETIWYFDADGDGFGATATSLVQCEQPAGYVLDSGDCADDADDVFPGAAPNDSADACMKDSDGDGWGDDDPPAGVAAGTDCDDDDSSINPDTAWYADADGDGFGDVDTTLMQCLQPEGYLPNSTDCDDDSPSAADTFPGAAPNDSALVCLKDTDGDDWGDDSPPAGVFAGTDCDDEDATRHPETVWYADTDGDGYGNPAVTLLQCLQPTAHVLDGTDCDDVSATAAQTFPGAAPNDGAVACMKDADGDDWGDDAPPAGVTVGTDCDDVSATAAQTFPGAAPNDGAVACMKDADDDDWGDDAPPAGVAAGTDCDDADSAISPETTWYADTDGDGFGSLDVTLVQCPQPAGYVLSSTDCDDVSATAAATFPGAAPNDSVNGCLKDVDADDWGDDAPPPGVTAGTDCDDTDPVLTPETTWYLDTDGDGYGDEDSTLTQCGQPAGHVLDGTDCDDTSATAADTFPGAAPNDDAGACLKDVDGDDWGDDDPPAGVEPGTDCDDVSATAAATFPGAAPEDSSTLCMKDGDGDDWGDDAPPAGVAAGTDCDDSDSQINPDTAWYADSDGDGFGDPGTTLSQCTQPAGYLADSTDCDDTSATAAATFPGAAPNDRDGVCMKDVDGDDWGDATPPAGVIPGSDCDDANPAVNPNTAWYADSDGDGYGDADAILAQCEQPAGYVPDDTDCDDTSATAASTFPGAAPNDSAVECMRDADGDDWGDDTPPAGVAPGTDCDDASAAAADTFPGAAPNDSAVECMRDADGDDWGDATPPADVAVGSDCDDTDPGINPDTTWYVDADGDGFGRPGVTLVQCTQPAGYVLDSTDCDDTSPTAAETFPGAAPNDNVSACMKDTDGDEWGDDTPPPGVTAGTDCDDSDSTLSPLTRWYADADGDGFGNLTVSVTQCSQPAGYVLDSTDCDDTSATAAATFPGAAPNDGAACMRDADGDDWGDDGPPAGVTPGTDCDDISGKAADTFPGAAPNDSVSACMRDADGDDWGDDSPPPSVTPGTDCDDENAIIDPDTTWYADTDGDGYGSVAVTLVQCLQPAGYVLSSTDCDDTSSTAADAFPGAAPNDSVNGCLKDSDGDDWGDDVPPPGVTAGTDCEDADPVVHPETTWYPDGDGDGYGVPGATLVQCEQPPGHVLDGTDCDDASATAAETFPGAAPSDSAAACMKDTDGDDWGDDGPPAGVTAGTDCDDVSATAAETFPGAAPSDSAAACMKDTDGDDWGDDGPPAGVAAGTDCDDENAGISPDTTWYSDSDGDGFGDLDATLVQCTQPAGHVLDSTDCDDTSATAAETFPGAAPKDRDGVCMKDTDGDDWGDSTPPAGVIAGSDCDDANSGISPDTTWHADTDADGFGDVAVSLVQCDEPAGYVLDGTDCDDTSPTAAVTFPGAAPNDGAGACMKDGDGDDWGDDAPPTGVTPGTDCDDGSSAAPETFPGAAPKDSAVLCMKDVDGDDWGDDTPPAGVTPGTDCDDTDPIISPDTTWYADTDGDGFGDPDETLAQCTQPAGHVPNSTDCDDTSSFAAATFPGSASNDDVLACMKDADDDDWGDEDPLPGVFAGTDCDDEDPVINPATAWYADTDGDGFGDPAVSLVQCLQPAGHIPDNTDCDDTSATAAQTYPGAAPNDSASACMKDVDEDGWGDDDPPAEVTAGTDCNDADAGLNPTTTWYADADGDGFGDPGSIVVQCAQPAGYLLDSSDCDDTSPAAAETFPGAAPNDSPGACMKDVDEDDWGDDAPPAGVATGTDCDDTDPVINPDTTWYADSDGDGFGDVDVTLVQCLQPASYLLDNTDCDDTSATAAETFPGAAPNDSALACMKDTDGDDWGDQTPPAGVSAGTDCDDGDAVLNPQTIWYADTDGDGFGDPGATLTQCTQPAGHLLDSSDCDDTSASAAQTFPGAAPNDSPGACMKDVDEDDWGDEEPPAGVAAGTDCNDADSALNPDTTWYADSDGDGFGDPDVTLTQCAQPAGYLLDSTDCDDTSATAAETFPGAAPNDSPGACMKDTDGDEWGDDNPPAAVTPGTDCDDADSAINPDTTWYADSDGDGFGDPGVTLSQCVQPAGYLLDGTDCDDTSASAAETFPGAAPNDSASACMKDSDGDDWGDDDPPAGVTAGTDCDDDDAELSPDTTWYADSDGDGFGDPGVTLMQCTQPAGHVPDNSDCDDTSASAAETFPGAAPNDDAGACMKDADGDDWGDDDPPAGVSAGSDCDDADAAVNPDTTWYADSDGDGFGDLAVMLVQCAQPAGHVLDSTDCDDTSATAAETFPGAAPNDSPGACMKDTDGDEWGDDDPPAVVTPGTDCDDADSAINPDTTWYADSDGDGFGDPGVTLSQCVQPAGYLLDGTDCDDTSVSAAETFPGAAPNDSASACMKDSDGDDWGDAAPPAGVTPGTDCQDTDDNLWSAPGEATGLVFESDRQSLSWIGPAELGGNPGSAEYDLLRSDQPDDFVTSVLCIAAGDSTSAEDADVPPLGSVYFYLARAFNACGPGSLGQSSAGDERAGADCP